jgi:hypothetical protein
MKAIISKVEEVLPRSKINIFGKDQLLNNTFPYYLLAVLMVIAFFGKI